MATKLLASVIMAGTAATAIALAPAAGATDKECADKGTATPCPATGHSSMNVGPGNNGGSAPYWPFGTGTSTPQQMWVMS